MITTIWHHYDCWIDYSYTTTNKCSIIVKTTINHLNRRRVYKKYTTIWKIISIKYIFNIRFKYIAFRYLFCARNFRKQSLFRAFLYCKIKLKALIIGGFKIKPSEDPADEFGKNLYDIVLEKIKQYNYPVCFDFPVGHQKNNFALKCGVMHQLNVKPNNIILKEI